MITCKFLNIWTDIKSLVLTEMILPVLEDNRSSMEQDSSRVRSEVKEAEQLICRLREELNGNQQKLARSQDLQNRWKERSEALVEQLQAEQNRAILAEQASAKYLHKVQTLKNHYHQVSILSHFLFHDWFLFVMLEPSSYIVKGSPRFWMTIFECIFELTNFNGLLGIIFKFSIMSGDPKSRWKFFLRLHYAFMSFSAFLLRSLKNVRECLRLLRISQFTKLSYSSEE